MRLLPRWTPQPMFQHMRRPPFFITGLPRSRTAWFANLFTTDSTLCFHEPAEPVGQLIQSHPGARIGVSCSGLVFRFRELSDKYPLARWLYVERDRNQALESLLRFTREQVAIESRHFEQVFDWHAAASAEMKRHLGVLVVRFEDLNRESVIRQAWAHLLPETQFPAGRWSILEGFNVQQSRARFRSQLKERTGKELKDLCPQQ